MPWKSAEELESLAAAIFRTMGATDEEAHLVAQHLVEANVAGHDSHGVLRIPQYVNAIRNGRIRPTKQPELVRDAPAAALLDGHLAFGQVIAVAAMRLAIQKARASSIGAVSVFNSNHVGRLASHTLLAAAQGMIGILTVNAGGAGQLVAPFGGTAGRLATNPISIAVPSPDASAPVFLDMATSVAPEGKLRAFRQRGQQVPAGWIIDHLGRPSTDPSDFYGPPPGALLPLGGSAGHKGFGLGFMLDILAGALSGAGCSRPNPEPAGDGLFLMAIDVQQFTLLKQFHEHVNALVEHVKSTPPAPGFQEVLVPGEYENRQEQRRRKEGILVEDKTWCEIAAIARELGLIAP
jgi:uncharacterized oxidoreductase